MDDAVRDAALESTPRVLSACEGRLERLYAQHGAELRAYLRRRLGASANDAEDVVQDTFVRYASQARRGDIVNARAYLFRTAHNLWIDERRRFALRSRPEQFVSAAREDRTPERVLAARERVDVLSRALAAMSPVRRRSFLLHRLHGLSGAAIARQTAYSESAIKRHIAEALGELEAALTAAESASGGR